MSFYTINDALKRIIRANQSSPVAIFRTNIDGEVKAVFANTVRTTSEINRPEFVGTYSGEYGAQMFVKDYYEV